MHIALFSECYTPIANGVVTSLLTLRERLIARGHTVYVFAPGAPQPEDDAHVFRLPALPFPRHPYHFARPFPRMPVDFTSLDIDIVHCHHPFTVGRLGAEQARRYNVPMVYTAHSLYDTMATYARSPLVRSMGPKAARGVVRRFCARAACVITPSRHTRDALIADGVVGPFAVVPSGVISLAPGVDGRNRIRKQLGIAAATPVLLYVGRLGPEKRLDLLLHSVAALQEQNLPAPARDFRLLLVGQGPCGPDLEALAAELSIHDRVIFAGAQPHATIGDWYAAGDIFTLPSPAETQGLVLLEAMSVGLPCVAVNCGGAHEAMIQRQTGLLVPPAPDALAGALETLLLDPYTCAQMGRRGRERSRAYSPDTMADGVLAVYNDKVTG